MKQLPLPYPVAKSKDPLSSFRAGEEFHKSGKAEADKKKCLRALRKHNGSTSKEIAQKENLDRYAVARRLPDLRRDGEVINCRQCHHNWTICIGDCHFAIYKNNEITWWIK